MKLIGWVSSTSLNEGARLHFAKWLVLHLAIALCRVTCLLSVLVDAPYVLHNVNHMRTDVNPHDCPLVGYWVKYGDMMGIWSNSRLSDQGSFPQYPHCILCDTSIQFICAC